MDRTFLKIYLFCSCICVYSSVLCQHLLLTSNVSVVEENNPMKLTCVLPSNGANTGWIVNGVRTETALLDDGTCNKPSPPPQGFIYTCVSSTVFTLTILQVKREQNGDQWKCDSWINGGTLYSNIVTLKVQDVTQQSMSQIGPIVGGAVAGILLLVVLVGLVYKRLTGNFKKKGVCEGLSSASPAKVQLIIGARYFQRQKAGNPANAIDTSAFNAVDSNNRKAMIDRIPNPDVDLPSIPVHSHLELEPDITHDYVHTYDYVIESGLRPKMALPPPQGDRGMPLRRNVDDGYLTPMDNRL